MEKNKEEDSKRGKTKKQMRWSIFFFLFGFLIMIFCAILQDKKVFADELLIAISVIGFLVCAFISLSLAVMAHPYWVGMEAEKIYEFYAEKELGYFPLTDSSTLEKRLSELKFKYIKEGLYRKWNFIFSLYKDHICYYIRIIENNEVEHAIQRLTIKSQV